VLVDGGGRAAEVVGDVLVGRAPGDLVVAQVDRGPEHLQLAVGEHRQHVPALGCVLPDLLDGDLDFLGNLVESLPEHLMGPHQRRPQRAAVGELQRCVDHQRVALGQRHQRARGLPRRDVDVAVELLPSDIHHVVGEDLVGLLQQRREVVGVAAEAVQHDAGPVAECVDVHERLSDDTRCVHDDLVDRVDGPALRR
jgi:hypothetical protein